MFGIASQLGFEPEVAFIHSLRLDRFASREAALADYVKMLRFAEEFDEALIPADAKSQVAAWLDAHLVPEPAGGVRVDAPRTFRWAFISWEV